MLPPLKLLLCASALGISPLCAQSFTWTIEEEDAQWGNNFHSLTGGGTYDRSYFLRDDIGTFPTHTTGDGTQGVTMGSGSLDNGEEGPYDGRSGIIWALNDQGISTRSDPNATFDLSQTGSSVTIRSVANYMHVNSGTSYSIGDAIRAQTHMFGLSTNSNYFGSAGDESLYVSLDTVAYDATTGNSLGQLRLYDHLGTDTNPVDRLFDGTALADIASTDSDGGATNGLISLDSTRSVTTANSNSPGNSYLYEIEYTNLGGGQIGVGIGVFEFELTGRLDTDTIVGDDPNTPEVELTPAGGDVIVNEYVVVNSQFTDLTNLRPIFGVHIIEENAPISGVGYDWEPEAFNQATGFVIPEASASLLAMFTGALMVFYRKR